MDIPEQQPQPMQYGWKDHPVRPASSIINWHASSTNSLLPHVITSIASSAHSLPKNAKESLPDTHGDKGKKPLELPSTKSSRSTLDHSKTHSPEIGDEGRREISLKDMHPELF